MSLLINKRSVTHFVRYCKRRLQRLRKNVGLSNNKIKALLCYEVTAFTPQVTAEHVLVLALLAERAWAYAMELKVCASFESKPNLESNERNRSAWRRHSRQRLAKAAAYGETMRTLSAVVGDDMLVRESAAYAGWLKGLELESRNNYGFATEVLESARAAYMTLAQKSLQHEDIFRERAADCLTATQRCAFAGGRDLVLYSHGTLNDKQVSDSAVYTSTEIAPSEGTGSVRWCGMTLEITAEKIQQQLRICQLEGGPVVAAISALSGGVAGLCCGGLKTTPVSVSVALNEPQYARRLQQLEDMARVARVECDSECQENLFSGGNCVTKSKRSLEFVAARATYEKLDLLFRRCDATVAERAAVWRRAALDAIAVHIFRVILRSNDEPRIPDDVLHLYDNLIQVTNEMGALTGVRDAMNETLSEALDARVTVLQAYKCHFLAETFSVHRFEATKAFALFRHASYLAGRARQEAEACEALQMSHEMVNLCKASRASAARLKATNALYCEQINKNQMHVSATAPSTRLSHLDVHDAPGCAASLIAILPKPKPVPCKPVLFNLAHNNLYLPQFPPKTSRGLFSWLRR